MEYKSTIKSMQYFFLETKKASNLVLQGLGPAEIKVKAVGENIFLVNSEARKKEIASTVLKRLKELDDFMIRQLSQGNVESGKLIVVYAIMKNDRLFFEFMNEVFKEKLILKEYSILFEAGLIKDPKKREIIKPLLEQQIIDHLIAQGEIIFANIFLGLN
jgi:hypothetical protein